MTATPSLLDLCLDSDIKRARAVGATANVLPAADGVAGAAARIELGTGLDVEGAGTGGAAADAGFVKSLFFGVDMGRKVEREKDELFIAYFVAGAASCVEGGRDGGGQDGGEGGEEEDDG